MKNNTRKTSTRTKSATLQLRMLPDYKQIIEQAAILEGKTLTEFATSSLQNCARETIQKYESMKLSGRDQAAFVKSLIGTAKDRPRLRAAAKRYKRAIAD